MHVYQPFDLALGLVMFPLGLIGLGYTLQRALLRAFTNTYADWRSVGMSAWFLVGGPAHYSRAFDPPHQESHLTNVLMSLEIVALSVIITVSVVAWVVRRRRGANGVLEQRTARGDRGKFEQAMAKVGAGPPDEQDRL